MTDHLRITTPDDWHVHFRDGEMLTETVAATARCFGRAIAMPNLVPPVTDAAMAECYRQRILAATPAGSSFQPLMTLYLTDQTSVTMIREARAAGVVAAKLYPAGATTNSHAGVTDITRLGAVLDELSRQEMPLLVHGEETCEEIDIFDRERIFVENKLRRLVESHPELKLVVEHITTAEAVQFVLSCNDNVAATITPQHLLLNRNDLLVGGIRPHNYCLPVLKRNTHQRALQQAAISGSPKFFIGSDSAPHEQLRKESACGCAGCYSAWSAIELYAQFFDEAGSLDKLEGFTSHYGADFYGLPRNDKTITLVRESWTVPETISLPNGQSIVPFFASRDIGWKVKTG